MLKDEFDWVRNGWTSEQAGVVGDIYESVSHLTKKELFKFLSHTEELLRTYQLAYQLPGKLVVVLDNSIIQDFKHRRQRHREVRALAFVAFSKFVQHWTDRETVLALPVVSIYEHLGRIPPADASSVNDVMRELSSLLSECQVPLIGLGFQGGSQLKARLRDVHEDALFLEDLMRSLAEQDWKRDLRAPIGVVPPMAVAQAEVQHALPLKYFDPATVRNVLCARVEDAIIQMSGHDQQARPISTGTLTSLLAKLNGIRRDIRTSRIKGLGDLELLQYCRIGSQFKSGAKHVLVGQTFDKDLCSILLEMSSLVTSSELVWLTSEKAVERAASSLFEMLHGNPFSAEDARLRHFSGLCDSYRRAVYDACIRCHPED